MPDVDWWRKRYEQLGAHSVGTGLTQAESELEDERRPFVTAVRPYLVQLQGPVLDFGCGVGRWVMDLPKPYVGLDLLPEHLDVCRAKYGDLQSVVFRRSNELGNIPTKSFKSIFTCTVLQHIVEPGIRRDIIRHFLRVLDDDGVFLSIEWSNKQSDLDYCTRVEKRDFSAGKFNARVVGEVVAKGVSHNVWFATKTRNFLDRVVSLVTVIQR